MFGLQDERSEDELRGLCMGRRRGDAGETQGRRRGDAGETQGRRRGDAGETQGRRRGDAGNGGEAYLQDGPIQLNHNGSSVWSTHEW